MDDARPGSTWRCIATLPPEPGSDGKIAVSLWLARDPRLAVVSSAQGGCVMSRRSRARQPPRRRAAHPRLVRVLPAEDRRDGAHAVGVDRAARAAAAEFRLGHLRRRRLDARAHARDGQAHPGRDRADAGRASHLRRARRATKSTTSSAPIATRACATSWRCAAIRPAASASATRRIRAAIATRADLVAGIKRIARFRGLGVGLSGEASGLRRRSMPTSTC